MSSDSIRVGVIGCGGIAQHAHLPAIARVASEILVSVADAVNDVAQQVGRLNGLDANDIYDDYRLLLQRSDIDAVVVCTSTSSHTKVCIDAMKAGKHVLLEKPMSVTVDQAQEMAQVARETQKTLMVAYNHSYDIACDYIKKIITDDELGDILYAEVFFYDDCEAWDSGAYRHTIRKHVSEVEKTAISQREELLHYVHNFDSHVINLMRVLIGEPLSLEYCQRIPGAGLWAIFEYSGFKTYFKNVETKQRRFEKGIEICGRKKRVRLNLAPPLQRYTPASVIVTDMESQVEFSPLLECRWPFELEHEYFSECILEGKVPMTNGAYCVEDVRIVENLVDMALK